EPHHSRCTGAVLPERGRTPGARWLLRDRGRYPAAPTAPAGRDGAAFLGHPGATRFRRVRHREPGPRLVPLLARRQRTRPVLAAVSLRLAGRAGPDGAARRY